ncbi:hypothetical protein J6590_081292 [Homalodisca vitripennis]|nr:hypothetical protein J6590_081292 [Homalodisca vitripennis]
MSRRRNNVIDNDRNGYILDSSSDETDMNDSIDNTDKDPTFDPVEYDCPGPSGNQSQFFRAGRPDPLDLSSEDSDDDLNHQPSLQTPNFELDCNNSLGLVTPPNRSRSRGRPTSNRNRTPPRK